MKKVTVKVPGKLYVAGEYAVVEPGFSAIVLAVDLFIGLTVRKVSRDFGRIFSKGFTTEPIFWERVEDQVQLKQPAPALDYILAAIHLVEDYVRALGVPLSTFDLEFWSELENETDQKLGLGSSGAVTTATVEALLEYYKVEASDLLIYKLSVLAQLKRGINSSFGDIAASVYTGWIRYTSFDRAFVSAALREMSIKEVVEMDWPLLDIQRLKVAKDVRFLIGWTGSPASSDQLVGEVQKRKKQSEKEYRNFLAESQKTVNKLTTALQTYRAEEIKQAIENNRQLLLQMGRQTHVLIETPQLTQLCEIANQLGAAAKTSGAGGGDSGIAFVFDEKSAGQIIQKWQTAGIQLLSLSVYTKESIN